MRSTLTGFIEAAVEEVAFDVEGEGHCAQQGLCEGLHVEVVLLHQVCPSRLRWMTVRPAQRFFREYIGMLGRQVQAHVEGFFEVAGFARVELLGGDGAVAAMVAGLGDVDLEFFCGGQGEEALGVIEHGGDALR
jgi:hypothetical protein